MSTTSYAQQITELLRDKPDHDTPPAELQTWSGVPPGGQYPPQSGQYPPQGGPPAQPPKKRKKRPFIVGGIILLIIIAAVNSSNGSKGNTAASTSTTAVATATKVATTTATPTTTQQATAAPAPPAAPAGLAEDNGWTLGSFTSKDDGLGDFDGTARVTNNTGNNVKGGVRKITLLQGSDVVSTLDGAFGPVAAGNTVSVDMLSQDKYKSGKFTPQLQIDGTY